MLNVVQKLINETTNIASFFDYVLYSVALMNFGTMNERFIKNKFSGTILML